MQHKTKVFAFHCSGANGVQWQPLVEAIGSEFDVVTPEHIGCKSRGNWHGQTAFSLAHEAEPTLALIDAEGASVHLVGHSYGGAVALHIAQQRPGRIASLTIYEPSAFYLLPQLGEVAATAMAEISAIADRVRSHVAAGDCRSATETFVEYWNGRGSWDAMHPKVQNALINWTPKAPLDFHALLNDTATLDDTNALKMPTLIMRGEHAPLSTRTLSDALAKAVTGSKLTVVPGAGHMGPITHASAVTSVIENHIRQCEEAAGLSRNTSRTWWRSGTHNVERWRLAS